MTSSSASPGTAEGGRFSRYVWKTKAVLKGPSHSTAGPAPLLQAPTTGKTEAHTVSSTRPISPQAILHGVAYDTQPRHTMPTASLPISVPRERNTYTRALALAAKYNIDLEPFEWPARQASPRVEKPVRLRVHRICHMCQTAFGSQKICSTCKHARCTDCTRFPPRHGKGEGSSRSAPRSHRHHDDEDDGSRVSLSDMLSASVDSQRYDGADLALKRKYRYMLTKPNPNGGQDLVRKKPMQRVRRTCHCCETTFQPNAKSCPSCGHTRCDECPRDPARRHKYPDGHLGHASSSYGTPPEPRFLPHAPSYPPSIVSSTPSAPGSARVYRRPRPPRKIHYTCDRCKTAFLYTSSHPRCGSCGHERCHACERVVLRDDEHPSHKASDHKLLHVDLPQVDESPADDAPLALLPEVEPTTPLQVDRSTLDRTRGMLDVREQQRLSAARVVDWRPAADVALARAGSTPTPMTGVAFSAHAAHPATTPPNKVVLDVFEMALEVDDEASAVEMRGEM